MDFWSDQKFDLQLNDYQGNCKWCYKKSLKKHYAIMRDDISIFDFPDMLEKKYGHIGKNKINGEYSDMPRTIFRSYMTADLLKKQYLELTHINPSLFDDDEEDEGCAQSCEPFAND